MDDKEYQSVMTPLPQPVKLVTTKSDVEYAKEIKEKIVVQIEPILKIIDEAKKEGFIVQFGLGDGPLGKQVLTMLKVLREY